MVGSSPILTDSTPSNKADMIMYDGEVTVVETDELKQMLKSVERTFILQNCFFPESFNKFKEKYLSEEK
jgi:hypothetical protein